MANGKGSGPSRGLRSQFKFIHDPIVNALGSAYLDEGCRSAKQVIGV